MSIAPPALDRIRLLGRFTGAAAALAVAFIASAAPPDAATSLDEQRRAFRDVYPAAERGDWEPARAQEHLLREYVLWPDLRAAWLRANLEDSASEVPEFLDRHATLKPARELRYAFALHLAATLRFADFLDIYRRHYAALEIPRLDCTALHAEILAGRGEAVVERGQALWLVGHSQVDECDPVFDYLRGAGILDEKLYRERFHLAVAEREFSLARYLARSLDDRYRDHANRWLAARDDPETFIRSNAAVNDSDGALAEQLLYALERLSYRNAERAAEHWQDLRARGGFSRQLADGISRHITLWLARQHRPSAREMLGDLPPEAKDTEVRRWLVRAALRQHAWLDVISEIEALPEDERLAGEWRYWLAVAQAETGSPAEAEKIFSELAEERSYYGFLSADALDREYAWAHAALNENESTLHWLSSNAAFVRARELFYVGLESRARSEWQSAVSMLQPGEKVQAALLAHRWKWHAQAMATAASVDAYDDLELRYPLPYREQFEKYSAAAAIPDSWAYGVARSESLFMPDIRSIAGAIGVMQLMPETGRRTAAEMNLPYNGLATLTDPDSNIRLGTFYLGKMLQRFGDHRVLATAAYNAGPLRVEKWLPDSGQLDARIWIENIPFNDTRSYVRRVLVTDAIFHWRLTGQTRRLSEQLSAIDASALQLANTPATKGAAHEGS